jgi:hypothetical protein
VKSRPKTAPPGNSMLRTELENILGDYGKSLKQTQKVEYLLNTGSSNV